MTATAPRGSIVVVTPVFEDRQAATLLFAELLVLLGESLFVIAIDDGSVHEPLGLESLEPACGVILRLKRNVGHQRAIAIGLSYAADLLPHAECIAVMDSDGEDMPSTLPEMLRALSSQGTDVVVAQRRRRLDSLRFRVFYAVYKGLFRLLTGRRLAFGNYMVLKPEALRRLVAMQELWTHVASCVLASRLRIGTCSVDRGARYAKQSQMKFVDLVLHGFRAAMVFVEEVLVRIGVACAMVAALAGVAIAATIGLRIAGFATPGWFSIALGILMLVFLQTGVITLLCLLLTGTMRDKVVGAAVYRDGIDRVLERPAGAENGRRGRVPQDIVFREWS